MQGTKGHEGCKATRTRFLSSCHLQVQKKSLQRSKLKAQFLTKEMESQEIAMAP